MMPDRAREMLAQAMAELSEALRHLDYSHQRVAALADTLEGVTES